MPKNGHGNRNRFKGLLIATAAAVALGAGGLTLLASQASSQVKATATSAATITPQSFYHPGMHPDRNILLRRPNAPAQVQWFLARQQFSKMRSLRKINAFADRLKSGQGPELDRTLLPVILPHDGGLIDTTKARMMSFGDAYALNMPQAKGMQITVYGNRSFVPADSGAISKRPFLRLPSVAEDVRIEQTEDGWTGTFTRFGVVYTVDVSCDDPNDPQCLNDTFIRNAIAQFDDVTMGAQATAEANQAMQAPPVEPHPIPAGTNFFDQVTKTISKIAKGG